MQSASRIHNSCRLHDVVENGNKLLQLRKKKYLRECERIFAPDTHKLPQGKATWGTKDRRAKRKDQFKTECKTPAVLVFHFALLLRHVVVSAGGHPADSNGFGGPKRDAGCCRSW